MRIENLLLHMIDQGASDLHFTAGQPPELRITGEIAPTDFEVLSAESIKSLAYNVLTPEQIRTLENTKELDASFGLKNISRFRINAFYQRGVLSAAIRRISYDIPSIEDLGLPPILRKFAEQPSGLFLVTGPTGSGKTTTLASMVDYINETRKGRVITIEDPIEFLHTHKKATINQRELGSDTLSYAASLKHVFRQDPDIILVGEMRDLETIKTVLTLAETGHLILSTLHTRSALHAISRIIDVFPSYQQQQIKVQLSLVLIGVIGQQLLPRIDGRSRVVAYEVMNVIPSVRHLIRENRSEQVYSVLQTGSEYGMCTMNQCLANLYKQKKVSLDEILKHSSDIKELSSLIES